MSKRSARLVGDVAEQIRGVTYDKAEARLTSALGFVPILRANNIQDDSLSFDDLVYVPQERVSAKQWLQRGDVVVVASSGSIQVVGKAADVRTEFKGGFGAFCRF